jgi:hypothetical protein
MQLFSLQDEFTDPAAEQALIAAVARNWTLASQHESMRHLSQRGVTRQVEFQAGTTAHEPRHAEQLDLDTHSIGSHVTGQSHVYFPLPTHYLAIGRLFRHGVSPCKMRRRDECIRDFMYKAVLICEFSQKIAILHYKHTKGIIELREITLCSGISAGMRRCKSE